MGAKTSQYILQSSYLVKMLMLSKGLYILRLQSSI